MTLSPIGDIANATMSGASTTPKTWETASDWDGAADQVTVAHETYGDLPGDDIITLGYDDLIANESDLRLLWHGHDSGSPVEDVSGNNNDGSEAQSPTYDTSGILNHTSIRNFDTDGGWSSSYNPSVSDPTTMMGWFKFSGNRDGNRAVVYDLDDIGFDYGVTIQDDGDYWLFCSGFESDTNVTANAGTWAFIAATFDPGNDARFHYYEPGGTWTHTSEGSPGTGSTSNNFGIGNQNGFGSKQVGGNHNWVAFLEGTNGALSDSEIEKYGSADSGYLTTATKSFSTAISPDLQNLSYSLNAQSITLDVIGSPGSASEEIVSQALGGSTSYSLSWSSTHTDFRAKINLSTTDITTSPTVDRVELSPP